MPQARVRLQPSPQGAVARLEKAEVSPSVTVMEQLVVTESPGGPPDQAPSDPKRFMPMLGGPITTGKIGDIPYKIGLCPRYDLFWKDARFRPAKPRVDIEFLRVKL